MSKDHNDVQDLVAIQDNLDLTVQEHQDVPDLAVI